MRGTDYFFIQITKVTKALSKTAVCHLINLSNAQSEVGDIICAWAEWPMQLC